MIEAEDIDFHHPADAGHLYAETNSFCITVPEENILASVYVVVRKGIGVMAADVVVYGDLSADRANCLYIDTQQHLPAPERLSRYETPNGLSVRALDPANYEVRYRGFDDTRIDFDFAGLMPPFDIHDPAHSPMARPESSQQHAGSGLGAGYAGHFDVTGHVTGTITVRGRSFDIDCVETMDHSWGTRPEVGIHSMGWMHAHFGRDLAFHWIVAFDPLAAADRQWRLAHGYVLESGSVFGLIGLTMNTVRVGRVLTAAELEVTDVRGRTYRLRGRSLAGAPWICYTSTETFTALIEWTLEDGRVGHGASQVNESMQSLNRRLGAHRFRSPDAGQVGSASH